MQAFGGKLLNLVYTGGGNSVIVENMDCGDKCTWPQAPVLLLTICISLCKFLNVLDVQNQKKYCLSHRVLGIKDDIQ